MPVQINEFREFLISELGRRKKKKEKFSVFPSCLCSCFASESSTAESDSFWKTQCHNECGESSV